MRPPAIAELEIPQRSGQVVCLPAGPQLLATAGANARQLGTAGARIAGVPLGEFRRRARARLNTLAEAFCAEAGIPLGTGLASYAAGSLLVVTGHQPFLFHPGIWIKHLLVDRLAGMGAAGLSMPVDSDGFDEIGVDVPALEGRLRQVRETLAVASTDVPYESHPAPTPDQWAEFLARVEARLRTLLRTDVQAVFAQFAAHSAGVRARSVGEFMTIVRRRYEGPRQYLELPVSRMSGTEEFARFVVHVAADGARFAEIYNRHLRAYRARFNIRTPAQPFPDLEVAGERVELPFWIVQDGRRQPVYLQATGAVRRLLIGTTEVAALRGEDPDVVRHLAIRPRALTLTAFTRLCVADLFVHGIGGARYDRVTDEVIREFFGVEPPQFAVVTATLHLPLGTLETVAERQRLQRRLLDVQHNPERVLVAPTETQQGMIDEKWRLIGDLDQGTLPRRARRKVTQRIREINEVLAADLKPERAAVEHRLAVLQADVEAEAVAFARTYPFCFFPPRTVDDLVAAQFEGPGHAR